jgi:hypothetical protein
MLHLKHRRRRRRSYSPWEDTKAVDEILCGFVALPSITELYGTVRKDGVFWTLLPFCSKSDI